MENEERKTRLLNKETSRRGFLKGTVATAGGIAAWAAMGGLQHPQAKAAPQEKPQMKFLFAQRENCTGCRACELACSYHHTKVFSRQRGSITVLRKK